MAFLSGELMGITEDQTAIATWLYKVWEDNIPYDPPFIHTTALSARQYDLTVEEFQIIDYAMKVIQTYNIELHRDFPDWREMAYQEGQQNYPLTKFGNRYKAYVNAYMDTLEDIRTHGAILKQFIWSRDAATKIKLQMIDAVVVGDVERVRREEAKLNSSFTPFIFPGAFLRVRNPVPAWTFNPSLLGVYTPPTTTIMAQPVYAPAETIAEPSEVEDQIINSSQIAPIEQANVVVPESQTLLAGFPWWGWLVLLGVGLAVIKGKKSKERRRSHGKRS